MAIDPIMKKMNELRDRIAHLEEKCERCTGKRAKNGSGGCSNCVWQTRINDYMAKLKDLFWNTYYDEDAV